MTAKPNPATAGLSGWSWGANRGARRHLFRDPLLHPASLCGLAHGGDRGDVFRLSKRLQCVRCLSLSAQSEVGDADTSRRRRD